MSDEVNGEKPKKKRTPWQDRPVADYEVAVMNQCRDRLMRLPLKSRARVVRFLAECITDEDRGPVVPAKTDPRQVDNNADGQAADRQTTIAEAADQGGF